MMRDNDPRPCRPAALAAGFTLIELLVVLAIVALLLSIAVPRYFQHLEIGKEAVLKENLRLTRDVIDKFFADTGRYPQSLDELVQRKYLRALPFDPVTESSSTWTLVAPEGDTLGGVFDLHSGAGGTTHDGSPFSAL